MQGAVTNISGTLHAVNSFGKVGLQTTIGQMSSAAKKQLSDHDQTGPRREGQLDVLKEVVLSSQMIIEENRNQQVD